MKLFAINNDVYEISDNEYQMYLRKFASWIESKHKPKFTLEGMIRTD